MRPLHPGRLDRSAVRAATITEDEQQTASRSDETQSNPWENEPQLVGLRADREQNETGQKVDSEVSLPQRLKLTALLLERRDGLVVGLGHHRSFNSRNDVPATGLNRYGAIVVKPIEMYNARASFMVGNVSRTRRA